jgi:hypothetical protein
MDSPWHEEKEVLDYMRLEADDEVVGHSEKVATEVILGDRYDVWDVHTDKNRWWVITNPTNLYLQSDFPSMNNALTFHIGLTQRVFSRQGSEAPVAVDERQRFLGLWRQWEQAARAQEEGREAHDFQAVGARCRETLLSFVHVMASARLVPSGAEVPKKSDFIHWSEQLVNAVAAGAKDERLRRYLKSLARQTWEYVSHVTHERKATVMDGELAVRFTSHLLAVFSIAIRRAEAGMPDACPACGSYRLATHWERDEDTGKGVNFRLCEVCDWEEEYEPQPLAAPDDNLLGALREPRTFLVAQRWDIGVEGAQ